MKNKLSIMFAVICVGLVSADGAFARGFGGGFHGGGGFRGGGFRPSGGFGGFHPSGFGGGGLSRSFNSGSFDRGSLSRLGSQGFGNTLSGLRTTSFDRSNIGRGTLDRSGFDRSGLDRSGLRNFYGHTNRTQLNRFLGLPSDAGLHSLGSSHTIDGYTIHHGSVHGPGGGKAHGTVITGPQGGQVKHGAVRGPRGNVAHGSSWHGAYNDGYVGRRGGFRHVSATSRYGQAVVIRRGFHGWAFYTPAWYRRYPGAWFAAGWVAGYAWRAATWPAVYESWGYSDLAPVYYDYGTNVVYQNNNVYVNGQDVGTTAQYYDQASTLASDGTAAKISKDAKWLPLGVFAVANSSSTTTNMVFQLAVNKQGIIRGNYTNSVSGTTLPVHGSVDKKTQRAAWTIGTNKNTVIETGIYNLTKDEAPALVHFGKDRTEQWLLVRMNQDDKPASTAESSTAN